MKKQEFLETLKTDKIYSKLSDQDKERMLDLQMRLICKARPWFKNEIENPNNNIVIEVSALPHQKDIRCKNGKKFGETWDNHLIVTIT